MGNPALKKKPITEEEAAEQALPILERYLARQTPQERERKLRRLQEHGTKSVNGRGTRTK